MLKKGSRLITVDGVRYLWRVRNRPTYCQGNGWTPLILAVERADVQGARMVLELPQAHPNNWMGEPVVALLPSDVAVYITTYKTPSQRDTGRCRGAGAAERVSNEVARATKHLQKTACFPFTLLPSVVAFFRTNASQYVVEPFPWCKWRSGEQEDGLP